jgi:hypothetical protein
MYRFCLDHEEWQSQGKEHSGIFLLPQLQISDRLYHK